MAGTRIQDKINQQIFGKYKLAYICVDHSSRVQYLSENIDIYGYGNIPIGADVNDFVDFMIGLDTHTRLNLPIVTTRSGVPAIITLVPDDEQLAIFVSDATEQVQYRQKLQQIANEKELLVEQQAKLMEQLADASAELAKKNEQLEEASRLQGYTNLVKQGIQEDNHVDFSTNNQYLHAVQRSSKHLLSLVENLLDHGKLDSGEIVVRPKICNLADIVNDVEILLKPLCESKRIELIVSTNLIGAETVSIDDSRLRQCLINLAGNAVKFTDHGHVKIAAEWAEDLLTITITDTGPGMSVQELEKIRLPFWQSEGTGKPGTGLGVTITDKIISLMGGDLSIKSTIGQGTTVEFDMAAPSTDSEGASANLTNGQGLKLLLVEDDSDIADLVMMMLLEKGVDVTHAENGAVALDRIKADNFDVVLMDLNMPVMTGYQAIEKLRADGNQIPVIVMSASALEHDRQRVASLGCDGYLIKPIDVNDIISIATEVAG